MSGQHLDRPEGPDLWSSRLWRDYKPQPGIYDELIQPDGRPRPHWARFAAELDAMQGPELRQRWATAERLIEENGVSYNVFADPNDAARVWDFDGIPLILPSDEWAHLEVGLLQRARLLNALLADIYGPQNLLRNGVLPPPLVLGNPQFLRPCHGVEPADGLFLHFYAADLARGPDGRWWVLSDRAEAPNGAGYALENRIVLSHCLPEAYRNNQVRRLAGFFQEAHDRLVALSGREDPRIVLLSPGPNSDAFFTHAYTARYLGYTLAEGADLTVRSDRVFLKTVEGLMPVDVIVRQIDALDADPLHFRTESDHGIAGLTHVVQANNVVVANALGSAVLECEALMAFMPGLCRQLLSEDPLLPNIATWWCGNDEAANTVRANLDKMAIRQTFGRRSLLSDTPDHIIGGSLAPEQRADLLARMNARGYEYVGQELVHASTTPVWHDGALCPRPVVFRAFVAAGANGYCVMPGGLARIADSDDARAAAVQRGDRSKDTWVLSDRPVGTLSLLRSPLSVVNVRRTGKDLPSRAADNLFWLGRYAERAEDMIRLIRTVLARLAEDSGLVSDTEAMARMVRTLSGKGSKASPKNTKSFNLEAQLRSLVFDPRRPYGLYQTLSNLHRTAALVRDRLSLDAWRTLNEDTLERPWLHRADNIRPSAVLDQINRALGTLSAFSGLEMENMTRGHGWRFLDMGRRLERAVHMSELFKDLIVSASDEHDPGLILLLEVADSFMTYRSRYVSTPMLAPVLDLLLLDETNPRSVAFQMAVLQDHVDSLPRANANTTRAPEQRIVLATVTALRLADIGELCQVTKGRRLGHLDELLDNILSALPRSSELIARAYFSHAEAVHIGAAQPLDSDSP